MTLVIREPEMGTFGTQVFRIDVAENTNSSATIGEKITIAWRHYYYYAEENTYHIFWQCRIYSPDGDRVTIDQYEDEQVVSQNGLQMFEHAVQFSTTETTPGTYEAEELIRDEPVTRFRSRHGVGYAPVIA